MGTQSGRSFSETVADRVELRELLSRYCRAVDRLDRAELTALFHDDATIDKGDGPMARDDYIPDILRRHALVPEVSHQITNVVTDFLSDDDAFVQSWGLAVERREQPDGGWADFVFRVRYGDECQRREGVWRILRRMLVIDHIMKVGVAPEIAEMNGGRFIGSRSAADPIEQKRSALLAAS